MPGGFFHSWGDCRPARAGGTVGRVRLMPLAAVVLVTACAVAGCTTVSSPAPSAPSRPSGPPPQRAADMVAPTPPPVDPLLATVRADPGRPHAAPSSRGSRPERGARAVPPVAPDRPRPAPQRAAQPRLPGGRGTCALGRTYGHWPAGSSAARICEGVYGR
jgi:hypothetical protein